MDIPAQVDAQVVDMVVMEVKVMEKMLLELVMVHIYSNIIFLHQLLKLNTCFNILTICLPPR
jgi:hypothetical protein